MDNSQLSNAITECYNIVNNFIQRTGDLQARNERDLCREIERLEREYNDAQQRLNHYCGLCCDWRDLRVGGKPLGEYTLGQITVRDTKFEEITLQWTKCDNTISGKTHLRAMKLGDYELMNCTLMKISVKGSKLRDVTLEDRSIIEIVFPCSEKLRDCQQGDFCLNDIELKDVKLTLGQKEISLGSIMLSDIKFGGEKFVDVQVGLLSFINNKGSFLDFVFFNHLASFQDLKSKIKTLTNEDNKKNIVGSNELLENLKRIKFIGPKTNNTNETLTETAELKYEDDNNNKKFLWYVGLAGVAGIFVDLFCMFISAKILTKVFCQACVFSSLFLVLIFFIVLVIYSLREFRILRKAKLEFERKRYEEQLRLLAKRNSQ